MNTNPMPVIRAVRIGSNTINLNNFLFLRTYKGKGTNTKGEFGDVFILKFYFDAKVTLELQFDTPEEGDAAREFVEAVLGGTITMPCPDNLQATLETPYQTETNA